MLDVDIIAPHTETSPVAASPWDRAFGLLRDSVARADALDARMVYVIARSPSVPAASMVLHSAVDLAEDGIGVAAIFAAASRSGADADALDALAQATGEEGLRRYVRILDMKGWGRLHERVRLGRVAVYAGPELRVRSPALECGELIDVRNQPGSAELTRLAFSSAWAVSSPLSVELTRASA